jgi:hypothetical protein
MSIFLKKSSGRGQIVKRYDPFSASDYRSGPEYFFKKFLLYVGVAAGTFLFFRVMTIILIFVQS